MKASWLFFVVDESSSAGEVQNHVKDKEGSFGKKEDKNPPMEAAPATVQESALAELRTTFEAKQRALREELYLVKQENAHLKQQVADYVRKHATKPGTSQADEEKSQLSGDQEGGSVAQAQLGSEVVAGQLKPMEASQYDVLGSSMSFDFSVNADFLKNMFETAESKTIQSIKLMAAQVVKAHQGLKEFWKRIMDDAQLLRACTKRLTTKDRTTTNEENILKKYVTGSPQVFDFNGCIIDGVAEFLYKSANRVIGWVLENLPDWFKNWMLNWLQSLLSGPPCSSVCDFLLRNMARLVVMIVTSLMPFGGSIISTVFEWALPVANVFKKGVEMWKNHREAIGGGESDKFSTDEALKGGTENTAGVGGKWYQFSQNICDGDYVVKGGVNCWLKQHIGFLIQKVFWFTTDRAQKSIGNFTKYVTENVFSPESAGCPPVATNKSSSLLKAIQAMITVQNTDDQNLVVEKDQNENDEDMDDAGATNVHEGENLNPKVASNFPRGGKRE